VFGAAGGSYADAPRCSDDDSYDGDGDVNESYEEGAWPGAEDHVTTGLLDARFKPCRPRRSNKKARTGVRRRADRRRDER
jgi:hypothetical protein